VPEAIEGSLMLASHALALVCPCAGDPGGAGQRDARYNLLRGYFAARMTTRSTSSEAGYYTVTLPLVKAVGRRWMAASFHRGQVVSLGVAMANRSPMTPCCRWRHAVLSGTLEALAMVEKNCQDPQR
jgi:CPA2 family monovalent cation:H+ antiporter-2